MTPLGPEPNIYPIATDEGQVHGRRRLGRESTTAMSAGVVVSGVMTVGVLTAAGFTRTF